MLTLWYSDTTGRFAFYINATSTPTPKNGIRAQSRALACIHWHWAAFAGIALNIFADAVEATSYACP
jgi:hypothetical protein